MTTKTTQHTPTPWRLNNDDKIVSYAAMDKSGDEPVCIVNLRGAMGGKDTNADSEFICLAVNNHEKLMEILRLFVENKKDIPENTSLNNLLYEAKCLLAHIEGNSL